MEAPDLVQALLRSRAPPPTTDAELIRQRMQAAEFPTIEAHLRQRIADQQWLPGTPPATYREDLNEAIGTADRLAIYERRGGAMAATICRTSGAVPRHRVGRVELPLLLVVYSADRDILVTGYQFSGMTEISIPEDALWVSLQP